MVVCCPFVRPFVFFSSTEYRFRVVFPFSTNKSHLVLKTTGNSTIIRTKHIKITGRNLKVKWNKNNTKKIRKTSDKSNNKMLRSSRLQGSVVFLLLEVGLLDLSLSLDSSSSPYLQALLVSSLYCIEITHVCMYGYLTFGYIAILNFFFPWCKRCLQDFCKFFICSRC